MTTLYVTADKAQLKQASGQRNALLWGDAVTVEGDPVADQVLCKAHGCTGTVPRSSLGPDDPGLLEVYVIDVGQGDSILIRTPDRKWHLVDGGPPKSKALLGKNARRFLAWKFARDLGQATVALDTVVLSHSDLDHFGGLTEILTSDFEPGPGETPLSTTVERFLNAGVAKYADGDELGVEGSTIPVANLVGDRDSFHTPPRPFASEYGKLADAVVALKTAAGDSTPAQRVSRGEYVDGYDEGAPVRMLILGPMPENPAGDLPKLGSSSVTVNGHSVVMRIDYGEARILLTGDINAASERRLRSESPEEFAADVAKACHHGSDDLDDDFTRLVGPRATVISSGDAETYAHPRPKALGAYAYHGRRSCSVAAHPEPQPPLVYSTEVARSIKLNEIEAPGRPPSVVVEGMVYGLLNVRTDGRRILCATRNEVNAAFDVEKFGAGASPADDPPPR